MKTVFLAWNGAFFRGQLANIMNHHRKRGDAVHFTDYHAGNAQRILDGADRVYIWNGAYGGRDGEITRYAIAAARAVTYCEIGWFPQGKFLYFDSKGTNGNCSLHMDSLDWLTDADFKKLEDLRIGYRDGKKLTDKGYVFCPLQLPGDQQIQQWSPYKWMGGFITDTRKHFDGKKVIFRKHPKDEKTYADLKIGKEGEKDLKELICGASLVYGINSTVLLEAALIGKPVVAIGKSFLSIGQSREHALAALIARQVPADTKDFTPWMSRGRGLEHLA